jgi:MarR family transcriptional regulator for hemolysin
MTLSKYDYENSIGRKIVLASKTVQQAFDLELQDKVDVTLAQWRALNIIRVQIGITQREIADKLALDASSLIPLIDRLERKKLVRRTPDSSDRRINRLYLTEKAESILDPMFACALSVKKILTKDISEDHLNIMQDSLERITQNLINHYKLEINCEIGTNIENPPLKKSSHLVERNINRK